MKRGWLTGWRPGIVLAVIFLAVFSPAWVIAAEAPHPPEPEQEGSTWFKVLVDLGIWSTVVFLLLMFVLGKWAWPMMLEGLAKREQAVASALEKARYAQAEAERIKAELELKYKQASDEIRALMEQNRLRAEQNAEELLNKAQADIQADRERLNREVESRADQALQELWTRVTNVAATTSTRAIRQLLSEEDHRRLVDEALSGMQQAAQERQRVLAGLS